MALTGDYPNLANVKTLETLANVKTLETLGTDVWYVYHYTEDPEYSQYNEIVSPELSTGPIAFNCTRINVRYWRNWGQAQILGTSPNWGQAQTGDKPKLGTSPNFGGLANHLNLYINSAKAKNLIKIGY